MELWSDYEGKTIAGAYPLERLIRPEGRSAFFNTSNGTGTPAVIRLTEAMNDEDEILACWKRVVELKQEHLVTIRRFGQTNLESVSLAFALMEPADGTLADILKERPLTVAETREVAVGLVEALQALHSHGMSHGQVEPTNVLAVGEVVKLRSDCVRECVEDQEFVPAAEVERIKREDVQALARVLLQALTLDKAMAPGVKLSAPFDQIIPHGLAGTWGLKEIQAALTPPVIKAAPIKSLVPESVLSGVNGQTPPNTLPPDPYASRRTHEPKPGRELHVRREQGRIDQVGRPVGFWIGVGVVAFIVLVLAWLYLPFGKQSAAVPAASTVVVANAPSPQPIVVVPSPKPAAGAPVAVNAETTPGFHVIAFTYNREAQAFAKVEAIRARHPELNAQVFAPSTRPEFYVALGGAMSEQQAEAVRRLAHRDGMPRDTFIRRYNK